jgi:hypothetical protein
LPVAFAATATNLSSPRTAASEAVYLLNLAAVVTTVIVIVRG